MLSKEKLAEKSLEKLMQFLKDEELFLQKQILINHAKLDHNRSTRATLLKIVRIEEEKEQKNEEGQGKEKLASHKKETLKRQKEFVKETKGKCIFKEKGSSKFCGRKTVKNSKYCVKHKKELDGSR